MYLSFCLLIRLFIHILSVCVLQAGSRVSPGSAAVSEGGVSASVEVVRPPVSGPWDYSLLCGVGGCVERSPSLLPEDEEGLPPLLITTGEEEGGGDLLVEERPAPCQILLLLEEGGPRPLTFVLNANLLVNIKLVTCELNTHLYSPILPGVHLNNVKCLPLVSFPSSALICKDGTSETM